MSLMTPLNRVLGLGTAKGAAEHWWLQRVAAVALLPLGLWLAYAFLTLPGFDYSARPQAALEVPLQERIAKIRAQKAEERARAKAKAARKSENGGARTSQGAKPATTSQPEASRMGMRRGGRRRG